MTPKTHADVSDLLARKALGRRERAQLAFREKLALLDRLREAAEQMKQARTERLKTPEDKASD